MPGHLLDVVGAHGSGKSHVRYFACIPHACLILYVSSSCGPSLRAFWLTETIQWRQYSWLTAVRIYCWIYRFYHNFHSLSQGIGSTLSRWRTCFVSGVMMRCLFEGLSLWWSCMVLMYYRVQLPDIDGVVSARMRRLTVWQPKSSMHLLAGLIPIATKPSGTFR